MQIRTEEAKDYFDVLKMTRQTFWSEERLKKLGLGALEHYMVHKARRRIMVEELSLVMEDAGEIVGHVMSSEGSYILDPDDQKHPVLTLGPLTVRKDKQKQGIGTKLLEETLKKAKALGYKAILLFGHPSYYPRFGFKEASTYGLKTEDGKQFPAFMALELEDGYLDKISGRYIVHPLFDEEKEIGRAIDFDQLYFGLGEDK